MKKFLLVLGIAMLAVVGGFLLWAYSVPVIMAKEAVKLKLTDPDSAQFRNVRRVGTFNVCGEVNAKTPMGGYAGFTAFHVADLNVDTRLGYFLSTSPAASLRVTFVRDKAFFASDLERILAASDTELVKGVCERK